eukprot:576454_1
MDGDNKATKHHGMMDIEDVNDIEFCDKGRISKDSLKSKGTWTWSRHLHSKHTYSRFNRSFGWMQRGNNELMVFDNILFCFVSIIYVLCMRVIERERMQCRIKGRGRGRG